MITVRGWAYGRTYDYECVLVSRTGLKAVFETKSEPKHIIQITPRYLNQGIGRADFVDKRGRPTTICAFFFDNRYVAMAFFSEIGEDIEIVPHEH